MRLAFFGSAVVLSVATAAFAIAVDRRLFLGEGEDPSALAWWWWSLFLGWLVTVVLGVVWLIAHVGKRSQ